MSSLPPPWIALGEAMRFLTALPVPFADRWLGPPSAEGVRLGLSGFPLAGWVLGLMAAGVGALAQHLGGDQVGAFLVLLVLSAATLGLHLDGVADVADALGSGRPRERKLEILKDSRIGAMGAIALVLAMLGGYSALCALGPELWRGALLAPPLARLASLTVLASYAPLPGSNLGRALASGARGPVLAAGAAYALLPALWLGPLWVLAATGAALAAAHLCARAARRSLGGINGDVAGLATEVAQVAVLLSLCIAARHA